MGVTPHASNPTRASGVSDPSSAARVGLPHCQCVSPRLFHLQLTTSTWAYTLLQAVHPARAQLRARLLDHCLPLLLDVVRAKELRPRALEVRGRLVGVLGEPPPRLLLLGGGEVGVDAGGGLLLDGRPLGRQLGLPAVTGRRVLPLGLRLRRRFVACALRLRGFALGPRAAIGRGVVTDH